MTLGETPTKSTEVRQHVDEEEAVVWLVACDRVQSEVDVLQLLVVPEPIQLL